MPEDFHPGHESPENQIVRTFYGGRTMTVFRHKMSDSVPTYATVFLRLILRLAAWDIVFRSMWRIAA